MKKIIAILLVLVACVGLVSCKKDEFAPPSGMITASSSLADFHLYVPKDWTVDLSTAAAGAYYSANDPSSVSVMAWELEHSDDTVDTWWEANQKDLSLVFQSFNLVSEENTTVDGQHGKKCVYTASLGEYDYKFMQVATVKGLSVYLFTYTALEANYDSHLDDIDQILEFWILR